MSRIRETLGREEGVTMMLVVVAIVVLSVLSTTLYVILGSEQNRSNHAVIRDASFAAAEAGLHSYMAKLLDDSSFHSHYLGMGESTRRSTASGMVVAGSSSANVAWSPGGNWTYPDGFGNWRSLGNGYEYSLQIFPPTSQTKGVDIVAVGRKTGSTTDTRKLETIVRQASVTDFQMLANRTITYGDDATTYGKVYATQDSNGVKYNVVHDGKAYGDIYAEGRVSGSVQMLSPDPGNVPVPKKIDKDSNPNIRTVIKSPVQFSSFLTSLSDIRAASTSAATSLDAAGKVWWLKFSNNGTYTTQQCTGSSPSTSQPSCSSASPPIQIPSNGAIYAAQTVVVSNATTNGGVKGRVTVASGGDVIIANDIGPVTAGVDVLGLVAANNMFVATWVPYNLTWAAATIAQAGEWRSAGGHDANNPHGLMTFTGSTATALGGSMGLFDQRKYYYEPSLLYLQPPWFPLLNDSLTTVLFRELST